MRKFRAIFLILIVAVVIIAGVFFLVGYFRPKGAGILIETNPAASVVIDGEQLGRTPYKETRKPGEVLVKLIPESFDKPLAPYETRVVLVSGIETVIRRDFGESEEDSSGETLSFERVGSDEASLSLVSIPDSAQITIDGSTKAFAPYKTSAIAEGNHTVAVSLPGYFERAISLKTVKGYKLTAIVKLAVSEELVEEEEIVKGIFEEELKPKAVEIIILETSVGFLRVRNEPSTLGKEVGRVEPGDVFELLEEDEKTGWFKIEYEEGEGEEAGPTGWISSQYAEKLDDGEETATPSAKESS